MENERARARVLEDFFPDEASLLEMAVREGEIVELSAQSEMSVPAGWLHATCGEREGLVPADFVEVFTEDEGEGEDDDDDDGSRPASGARAASPQSAAAAAKVSDDDDDDDDELADEIDDSLMMAVEDFQPQVSSATHASATHAALGQQWHAHRTACLHLACALVRVTLFATPFAGMVLVWCWYGG